MLAIQNHIDDVITYTNNQKADLSAELATHIDAFTTYQNTIGSITVQDNAYTITNDSSYLKLLDTKLLNEINALKTGTVADNTAEIAELNTLLQEKYGIGATNNEETPSYILGSGIINDAIEAAITAEESRATKAEQENAVAIAAEKTRAEGVESQ